MQQENFSPQESLQLIDSMINKAKSRFNENGFLYLLWGWLILICAVGHFILLQLGWFKHPEIIWASCWLAVIFQVIYLSKAKKKEKVKTYSDHIIDYIWISFGICMFIMSFILGKTDGSAYLNSMFIMLYGVPTFLSGVVMQFKPLKNGGIICWILAIASAFITPVYSLLLLALAVISAWIIPGYLLRKKFRKQNN